MIATAPGKLIIAGEYAVLDGATAVVLAVDRRAIATRTRTVDHEPSTFLIAVADELAARFGRSSPQAIAGRAIAVDSRVFFRDGPLGVHKLGLGSSAAVTVAATAYALGARAAYDLDEAGVSGDRLAATLRALARRDEAPCDLETIRAVASAAHANAQGPRGTRGSGADIAAAVHGGAIAFTGGTVARLQWPAVTLLAAFTHTSADTATLVARVGAARVRNTREVDAAVAAIADASQAVAAAADGTTLIAALVRAAAATDQLAAATGIALVPPAVARARPTIEALGGVVKTTGAGGGDIVIAVIPLTASVTIATQALVAAGLEPLALAVDPTGVDLRASAQ